jgi:hypothetical protein
VKTEVRQLFQHIYERLDASIDPGWRQLDEHSLSDAVAVATLALTLVA